MSTRRGFFALIGNAAVTGLVAHRASAKAPTLILPPTGLIEPEKPLLGAQFASGRSQMHAFIDIKGGLPEDLFLDWLEGGLRMVEGCKPGGQIHRAMEIDRAAGRRA